MFGGSEMAPTSKQIASKPVQKWMRKMMPTLTEFGIEMEPKWIQQGIQKSMFFWLGFWKPLETSAEPRRSVGGAARVTLSPADPPGRRHIIKEYFTITNKEGVAFRI